jgi:hypothetical protein
MHMFMSCHQNAGQNHNQMTAYIYLKSVAKLKYLGMTIISITKKLLREDYISGMFATI